MQDVIGIDVSKAALDAYCSTRDEFRQFENAASGLASFFQWASNSGDLVVFEGEADQERIRGILSSPNGAYHRELERMLTRCGLTDPKVNPHQAKRFAEATGRVAKTDRLDAEMLARMGRALQFKPT